MGGQYWLCIFWHCHPYFTLQFYSFVFYTCIICNTAISSKLHFLKQVHLFVIATIVMYYNKYYNNIMHFCELGFKCLRVLWKSALKGKQLQLCLHNHLVSKKLVYTRMRFQDSDELEWDFVLQLAQTWNMTYSQCIHLRVCSYKNTRRNSNNIHWLIVHLISQYQEIQLGFLHCVYR